MNIQPLEYAASRGSRRFWRRSDIFAFACGALAGGIFVGIYFLEGNGIFFMSGHWWDIAMVPGYEFGAIVYGNIIYSTDTAIAAGIGATILGYGLMAVLVVKSGGVLLRLFWK